MAKKIAAGRKNLSIVFSLRYCLASALEKIIMIETTKKAKPSMRVSASKKAEARKTEKLNFWKFFKKIIRAKMESHRRATAMFSLRVYLVNHMKAKEVMANSIVGKAEKVLRNRRVSE